MFLEGWSGDRLCLPWIGCGVSVVIRSRIRRRRYANRSEDPSKALHGEHFKKLGAHVADLFANAGFQEIESEDTRAC